MTAFVVEGIYEIRGRGPCITRSLEESRAAWRAGDRFEPGDIIRCGALSVKVLGVERMSEAQGGLLLDADRCALYLGQVWRKEL